MAETRSVLEELRALADPSRLAGMARVGIDVEHAHGVSVPHCRRIARAYRRDHALALGLWASGIHEARILASMVDDSSLVTDEQMEMWAADFGSWDLCDQTCGNLFRHTPYVWEKAGTWARRPGTFVKRAGFTLLAEAAVHDRDHDDAFWIGWFPLIAQGAQDERNYVKKAVSWSLRQIGKRNLALNAAAIEEAERLREGGSRSARWIANDALRELRSDAVRSRLSR